MKKLIIIAMVLMATTASASNWRDLVTRFNIYMSMPNSQPALIMFTTHTGSQLNTLEKCQRMIEILSESVSETSTDPAINVIFFCVPYKVRID